MVRIAFIGKEVQPHSIYPCVAREIERRGAGLKTIAPGHDLMRLHELTPDADLYVLRARSLTAFTAAAAIEAAGGRLLVPLAREAVVRNRFLVQQTLIAAGVPTPHSWIASTPQNLVPVVRDRGTLVVKQYDVSFRKQTLLVESEEDLPDTLPGPLFAQELVPAATAEIKVYGIGEQVFAIRRRFPEKRGQAVEVPRDIKVIAAKCRLAFGVELYGFDLLESDDGFDVVDFTSMPSFKDVENVAPLVAELMIGRASR